MGQQLLGRERVVGYHILEAEGHCKVEDVLQQLDTGSCQKAVVGSHNSVGQSAAGR